MSRMPSLYIPHGGGPCFFIKPEDNPPGMPADMWDGVGTYLRSVDTAVVGSRPKAVLVVSAHWMTPQVTFGNAGQHHLLFDYYNFPSYTYELEYPVKGAPAVAARAAELLAKAGIPSAMDAERGIDHGVFIPFMLIYPDADVPIVPMSLQENLNAAEHVAIGRALAPLRDEGVLIVGSGMSFHNMRAMMTGMPDKTGGLQFDDWLGAASTNNDPATRDNLLSDWENAPGARAAHPARGEEHLIPLMVAAGAGGDSTGQRTSNQDVAGMPISAFKFG